MTKKQFGIIFTLMLLIVCVGLLATKLNSDGMLTDPGDLSQVLSQGDKDDANKGKKEDTKNKDDKATISSQDQFYALKTEKETQDSGTIQKLEGIIKDDNTSQSEKDIATNELTQKTMKIDNENRIEVNIKNKGFEDVLCFIEGNKVRVVVKATEGVTDEQTNSIQEIVEDVSNISDVIIEVKK